MALSLPEHLAIQKATGHGKMRVKLHLFFMLQGYWRDSHKKGSGDGTVRAQWGVCCAVS